MKKILLSLIISLSIWLPLSAADSPTGKEIMEIQKNQHKIKTEVTKYDMILVDKKGRERKRVISIYVKDVGNSLNKTMLKFSEPADIAGVGLLTWEQGEDKDDDQWLYLPAQRQVKRISSSGKKNQFMGTDLAFEDLRPENLQANNYKVLGEEKIGDDLCWKIEATPATAKEKKDSGYSKRIIWIRKDIYFSVKTEFYDKRGNLAKLGTNEDFENIEGNIWRSKKGTTESLKRKTKTIMATTSRDTKGSLEESFFSQNNLKKD